MLIKNHRQESLSRAYVQAIAGRCGMLCSFREFDYGIDGAIHEVWQRGGRYVDSGFSIDIQAKSTTTAVVEGPEVVYDLEAKTYADLRDPRVGAPRILVLLILPELEDEWTLLSEEQLSLRRCAYWCSLRGAEARPNTQTVRIRIPRVNQFSIEGLKALMTRRKKGEPL